MNELKLYNDYDADLKFLKNKTIAVLGYGSQGSAQAMCMKDSGLNVIIGLKKKSTSRKDAKKYGFEVFNVDKASERADIIHILLPDEVQAQVYEKEIKKHLKSGKTISFSHGFNICFGFIKPPENVDVIMVAPKGTGKGVREEYLRGSGAVPGLISIKQDFSGNAKNIALAMAKACGFTKLGCFECTFEQETYEDLFSEQAILCGGISELIKNGFEVLVEAGYPPEMAYFECLYETKLITDLLFEGGIGYMWSQISNTAEYGGRTRGKSIITAQTKKKMKALLADVESGKFANEWIAEYRSGMKNFNRLRRDQDLHKIDEVGRKIRLLFKK